MKNIIWIILALVSFWLCACGGGGGSASPVTASYVVTPNIVGNGSISPSTAQTILSGATTNFTVTPASGYRISSATGCGGTLTGNTYTTAAITNACMVSVSFSTATTAIIKISTSGIPASGTALSGVGITITLPTGVTVKANSDGSVASGVVTASGVAANNTSGVSTYIPASGSTPATLSMIIASTLASGFGVGEFVTVNADIASGYTPQQADFVVTIFKPADLTLNLVTGLTAVLSITAN